MKKIDKKGRRKQATYRGELMTMKKKDIFKRHAQHMSNMSLENANSNEEAGQYCDNSV